MQSAVPGVGVDEIVEDPAQRRLIGKREVEDVDVLLELRGDPQGRRHDDERARKGAVLEVHGQLAQLADDRGIGGARPVPEVGVEVEEGEGGGVVGVLRGVERAQGVGRPRSRLALRVHETGGDAPRVKRAGRGEQPAGAHGRLDLGQGPALLEGLHVQDGEACLRQDGEGILE